MAWIPQCDFTFRHQRSQVVSPKEFRRARQRSGQFLDRHEFAIKQVQDGGSHDMSGNPSRQAGREQCFKSTGQSFGRRLLDPTLEASLQGLLGRRLTLALLESGRRWRLELFH